jgi:hypothetical protein
VRAFSPNAKAAINGRRPDVLSKAVEEVGLLVPVCPDLLLVYRRPTGKARGDEDPGVLDSGA